MSSTRVPPTTVAIVGSSISLPQDVDTREKLFELVRDKRQVSSDHVESGRYLESDVEVGRQHPWKLHNRFSNAFRATEREEFDTAFFHIPGKVTKNMQIEQCCVLQAAYEAVEDSGITLQQLHNTTTGVFVAGYCTFLAAPNAPDETNMRGQIMSTLADQVAYFLGTHGPTVTLETACSSSLVAVALAVSALQKGDCDLAIVVGNNSLTHKDFHLSLQACGVLVEGPASYPFDEDAPKGFLRCEGTGAMVLRRTPEAVAEGDRILAEIVGAIAASAGSADGCTEGAGRVYEQPCAKGMREMFKRCTTMNGIATSEIDYMECHATGTAVGDVIELEAVGAVYGEAHNSHNPLRVASIKSNIGHAEIAAGIFSLTKAVEMLRKRVFLPTAGVTKPRSDFDWAGHNMRVQQTVEPFPNDKKVIIAVSSFGIGGSYGHCLVREWRPEDYLQSTASEISSPKKPLMKASSSKKALADRPRAPPASESSYQLLPLSGFSLAHLKQYATNMAAYLRAKPTVRLADVCGTVALRRSRFPFRKAFVASSTEDLAAQLETFASSGSADAIGEARTLRTAFILTGQGSQWAKNGVELMDTFPIYRKAAETIDKQFTALAGWSLLEKINTLSTDEMRETKFAQPITFMVQVALLETLKHFSVFPDVVIGHSAGEVTAAYAAGLLTLEEAVQVVYHRSSEQQKLAGTGRMLAIGLGSEEVLELIKSKPALELACMNSPSSSVVAGPEDQLTALKESLPQGTSSTFIPGNIAFHSSRCQPILESMKKRLAFLDSHVSSAGWSVPLVSTVSGKVVSATPPQYWADNVRNPVLFQRAIETAFNMEPAPEVVVEIGPHRTLVGPAQQTIQGMEGKSAKVVSILNRKESNALTVLQTLGTLFESGVNLNFSLYFKDDVHYKFEEELPKHPYMKKNIRQGLYPVIFHEANVSDMNAGPAAGSHRTFSDTFVIELCDRTAKALTNHKMGGEAVVPGGFYSEMALEANGVLPVTLVNVEFKAKLSIPKTSAGDNATFVVLNFKEEQDNVRSFTITSCPSRDKYHERPVHVEHCSGKVVKHNPLDENNEIIPGPVPEAHGIMGKLELKDLGKEGLAALRAAHCECEHATKDSFYETYAQEGRNEYIDNFKLTTGLWVDPVGATVLSRLEYDNSMWEKEKGFFAVELLDNMTHQSLYSTFVNVIYYAGGYEAAHFLRTPETSQLWALWRPDPYMTQVGRKKMSGDFLLYDDNGKLCVHIHKYFCMFIIQGDTYKLCTLDWQYANLVTPQAVLSKSLERSVAKGLDAWGPASNRAMTAWLAKQLAARGIVTLGSGETPLNLKALAANASSSAITLPAAAKLAERIDGVLDALVKKLTKADKEEEAPSASTDKEAKVVELDDNLLPLEEKEDVEFNEDEMTDLRAFGTLARSEAEAVAEALLALAEAEQKAHGSEPVQAVGIGNAPFVLRVLEIAQENVTTGFERLSYLELPAHLRIEYFVASHSAKTLKALVRNFNRRCKNVVLRRVLLPSGRAPTTVLKDMTFHAVIFDDWVRSGSGAWAPEEEEAEEAKSVGSVLTPAANALALLRPFLAPSAQVMVRGMASEPVWVDILSQISTKPATVPDSTKAESDETLKEACALAAKEWNAALETVGAKGVDQASDLLLLGSLPATFDVSAGRYIVVASDEEQVQAVRKAALAAAGSAVELDVVMLDDSTTVEALTETLMKVLDAAAAAGVKVEELSDEDSGVEETKSSDSNPRRVKAEDSARVKGLLFTAALNDTSVIGEDGFSRLLRLSQALMKCEEGLTKHLSPAGEGPSLWVLTQGVYGGDLRPNQGSLQGLTTVLYSELRLVNVKLCDMSTKADLSMAVELTLSRAREQSYRVDQGNVRVARFCGLNRDELKASEVMPSSKKNFFVDTSAGELVLKRATPHPLGVMTAFYRLRELPAPGDNEVTIDIHAAALNFRDVMVALNMLAEKSFEASYYGKNLGLEAAGIVSAVGKNVKHLKVGDPVMCGEPRCFANRLNAPADRVVPLSTGDKELDASMTKEQRETSLVKAAATQSVYNTCHHALINLARIRKGERVLIHAAAGGVGHAAISICKYMGAVIYATAGTPEKRQLVKDMGVDYVYDSRSTTWFNDVMRDTNNEGVDVVLNSLAGLHQRLGVQALRSSGRFLEIGKMDIYDNASLGLIVFRKNISFFAIDMDRLALDDPAMSADVAREVGKRIQAGDYHSLPTKLFPMGQLREALEYMKSGKHVGKVVLVNYDQQGKEIPTTVGLDAHIFRPDITYLITGAAGGFGAKLIRYAFIQGARHFIITTRNPNVADTMSRFRYIVEESGVTIQVVVADTAKEEDIKKMLDVARKSDPPCKAIYHLAGISGDVKVGDMKDREDFEKVALCKAKGAWMLSELSRDLGLEQFVTVSSIAALIGGMGNAAYSAANAFQDALVRYRRAQGLPATTFNMSSLSDAGILVKNLQARRFQMKMGVEYMTAQKAMEEIELGMQANLSPVVTMFFKEQTRHMFPSQAAWSHLLDEQITLGISGGKSGPMSMKEVAAFLAEEIKSITQASEVLVTSSLVSLGLDSFGFVELGGRIQKQFNIDINSVKLTPEQTLMEVANLIFKLQKRQEGNAAGGENGEGSEEEAEAEALASSAAMGVMMKSRFDADKEVRSTASLLKKSVSARLLSEPSSLLSKTPSAYVLFGATGLMGSHVLRYIIKGGAKKVYCIVRAATDEAAFNRIVTCMSGLRIWKPEFADAIVPLAGDLLKEDFGLRPASYELLVKEGAHVVHAAGSRAWHMDVTAIDCNTKGVMNCVGLARKNGSAVHYVSSSWLDIYDAAETDADRLELNELPYMGIKRRGEEILRYAAKNCGVRCYNYRVPLLSVNSKGGFFGDFILLTAIQGMINTGVGPDVKGLFPIQTTDSAAKFMVRTMKAVPLDTRGKAPVYTSLPYAELVPWETVADMAEQMRPGHVRRNASRQDYVNAMAAIIPRQLLEGSGASEFAAALERASANLRVHAKPKKLSEQMAIALAKRKEKQPASVYFKDYVRRKPETITHGSFTSLWQQALERRKREEAEAEAARQAEEAAKAPAVQVQ